MADSRTDVHAGRTPGTHRAGVSGEAEPGLPVRGLAAYVQIEQELAGRIERGVLRPGARLPAERDFARDLGVSRMTLRQALSRLEHRGLIVRVHGRGTFVAEPKLHQRATTLRGFFRETIGQGVVPATRTLEKGAIYATRALAAELDIRIGEEVYKVVRLRSGRGAPVVLETSFFPASTFPGLLDLDLDHQSIYQVMEDRYDARPVRGEQAMEAVSADPPEAELLGVPAGSPLMLLERTAWDRHGRRVEYARDLYRGDRSRFTTELGL